MWHQSTPGPRILPRWHTWMHSPELPYALAVYSFGTDGGLSFGLRDGCKPKPLASVFRGSVEALELALVP